MYAYYFENPNKILGMVKQKADTKGRYWLHWFSALWRKSNCKIMTLNREEVDSLEYC